MDLSKQIYVRKSCRKYSDEEVDLDVINDFISSVKPLKDNIGYHYKILAKDDMNLKTRWSSPYYLALYTKSGDDFSLTNLGFVFQQVSLFLQSIGIGSCWVGMASLKQKESDFVIAISFGKSDKISRDTSAFKRKKLSEISDVEDERLIPAQLAPSAINSQPWYFKHSGDGFDVYQVKQNILKRQILKNWNPIDIGIALAHLYVSNKESFSFEIKDDFDKLKGKNYIGSIQI